MRNVVVFTILLFLLYGGKVAAQTMLTIVPSEGDEQQAYLSMKSRIIFAADSMVVWSDVGQDSIGRYAMSEVNRLVFSTNTTVVKGFERPCVRIFPNPVSSWFYIDGNEIEGCKATIYSINGMEVYSVKYHIGSRIDVSSLQDGLYILQVGNCACKLLKR